jgi:hypothetical protein
MFSEFRKRPTSDRFGLLLVENGAQSRVIKKSPPKSRHPVAGETVERLSISTSGEDRTGLEKIATDKRVSLAWVIRDAVSRHLSLPKHEAVPHKFEG